MSIPKYFSAIDAARPIVPQPNTIAFSLYKIALRQRKSFPLQQGYDPLWNKIIKPKCINAGITFESDMIPSWIHNAT